VAACDGTPATPPDPEAEIVDLDLAHSFHVTLHMEYEDAEPAGVFMPEWVALWLRIDDSQAGSQGIFGALDNTPGALSGHVSEVAFDREDSGKRVAMAPLEVRGGLPDDMLSNDPDLCFQNSYPLDIETLWLGPVDDDGDGTVDGIIGSVTGVLTTLSGDILGSRRFTATLAGALDTTAPYALLFGSDSDRHVLDTVDIALSEPLSLDVQARLVSDTGEIIELERRPEAGPAYSALRVTPQPWLAFGTRYTLEFEPGLIDMAGHGSNQANISLETTPDPGFFAEDGFEGPVAMIAEGNMSATTSVSSVPAISGTRSIAMGWDSRMTLRLPVDPGDSHLRMNARALSVYAARSPEGAVIVHGASRDTPSIVSFYDAFQDVEFRPTGDEYYDYVSALQPIEVALPATADGEVLVVIEVPFYRCISGGSNTGLLIDDLRVE
jgi:hypothetical protein